MSLRIDKYHAHHTLVIIIPNGPIFNIQALGRPCGLGATTFHFCLPRVFVRGPFLLPLKCITYPHELRTVPSAIHIHRQLDLWI